MTSFRRCRTISFFKCWQVYTLITPIYIQIEKLIVSVCVQSSVLLYGDSQTHNCRKSQFQMSSEDDHLVSTFGNHQQWICSICSLSKTKFATGTSDGLIKTYNVLNGNQLTTLNGHSDCVRALCMIDHNTLASASVENTINVWNLTTNANIMTLCGVTTSRLSAMCAVSPHILAVGSYEGIITLYDVKNKLAIYDYVAHWNRVLCMCMCRVECNSIIASGGLDNTVQLWDVARQSIHKTLRGHLGPVQDLCIVMPQTLASASQDFTIKIWDIASGECTKTLAGHSGPVTGICASAVGLLASSSADRSLRLWNMRQGTIAKIFSHHSETVRSVCMISGRDLATWSYDGTIKKYNVYEFAASNPGSLFCEHTIFPRPHNISSMGRKTCNESSLQIVRQRIDSGHVLQRLPARAWCMILRMV